MSNAIQKTDERAVEFIPLGSQDKIKLTVGRAHGGILFRRDGAAIDGTDTGGQKMTKDQLAALGFSEADVLEKLADRLCEQFIGDGEDYAAEFARRMQSAVTQRVDEVLEKAIAERILPRITEMVEGICLQETNKWGEARGQKLTFVEYLTQRVDAYIREEVDHNGKPKNEDSYGWRAHTTRIAYMIHEHLQYSIQQALAKALGDVNSSVRVGLEEAVKLALASIKVKVETKVARE